MVTIITTLLWDEEITRCVCDCTQIYGSTASLSDMRFSKAEQGRQKRRHAWDSATNNMPKTGAGMDHVCREANITSLGAGRDDGTVPERGKQARLACLKEKAVYNLSAAAPYVAKSSKKCSGSRQRTIKRRSAGTHRR